MVFVGHRRRGHFDAGQVDAFVVGQWTPDEHAGDDFVSFNRQHFDLQKSVVEQEHIAGLGIARQTFVGYAGAVCVAQYLLGGEDELCSGFEHGAGLYLADADFGALQVLQNRHGFAALVRFGADGFDGAAVIIGAAMRKVQPRDIHAFVDEVANHFRVRLAGPMVQNNLGPTVRARQRMLFKEAAGEVETTDIVEMFISRPAHRVGAFRGYLARMTKPRAGTVMVGPLVLAPLT